MILAIDPGSQKCGMAIVDYQGSVLEKMVIPAMELSKTVGVIMGKYRISAFVVGDRTNSRVISDILKPFGLPIEMVDENNSSCEGRRRYLKDHSKGLLRLIPIGLRVPGEAYDDYVAVILAERFLKKKD